MSSAGKGISSGLLSWMRSVSLAESSDSQPLSDSVILGIALAIGFFICVVSALANAFLISTRVPAAQLWIKVNAAGGIVAILLTWKLLRWSRERNRLIRQRDSAREGLNHEIRNALHVIYLETYSMGNEVPQVVKENVARIDNALNEFAPMPVRRCTRRRSHDRILQSRVMGRE